MNSPLKKASFKIWWHLFTKEEFKTSSILAGALFKLVHSDFPIMRAESNDTLNPFSKGESYTLFEKEDSDFPYLKLGSNSFYIVYDKNYTWDDFKSDSKKYGDYIIEYLSNSNLNPDHFHLELNYENEYADSSFINNFTKYSKDNLNLNFENTYLDKRVMDSFAMKFKIKGTYGLIEMISSSSDNSMILNINGDSGIFRHKQNKLEDWLDECHNDISELFKNVTKGKRYETFE